MKTGCCLFRGEIYFSLFWGLEGQNQVWVLARPRLGLWTAGVWHSHPAESRANSLSLDSYKGPNLIHEGFPLTPSSHPNHLPKAPSEYHPTGEWGFSVCMGAGHTGKKHLQQRSPAWRTSDHQWSSHHRLATAVVQNRHLHCNVHCDVAHGMDTSLFWALCFRELVTVSLNISGIVQRYLFCGRHGNILDLHVTWEIELSEGKFPQSY